MIFSVILSPSCSWRYWERFSIGQMSLCWDTLQIQLRWDYTIRLLVLQALYVVVLLSFAGIYGPIMAEMYAKKQAEEMSHVFKTGYPLDRHICTPFCYIDVALSAEDYVDIWWRIY